jgi:hypothetical protein
MTILPEAKNAQGERLLSKKQKRASSDSTDWKLQSQHLKLEHRSTQSAKLLGSQMATTTAETGHSDKPDNISQRPGSANTTIHWTESPRDRIDENYGRPCTAKAIFHRMESPRDRTNNDQFTPKHPNTSSSRQKTEPMTSANNQWTPKHSNTGENCPEFDQENTLQMIPNQQRLPLPKPSNTGMSCH